MKVKLSTPASPDLSVQVKDVSDGKVIRLEHPSHAFDDEKYAYWIKAATAASAANGGINLLNLMTGKIINVNGGIRVTMHEATVDIRTEPTQQGNPASVSREQGSP